MDTSAKVLRVLVTAGAAGIGLAIARTFRDHGAKVHVCDVDDKALRHVVLHAQCHADDQGRGRRQQALAVDGDVRYLV